MCLVALPKGWVISLVSGKEQTLQHQGTGVTAPASTSTESANVEHPVGLSVPQEPGGRPGLRGHVLERCCDSPSTEGPARQHFLPQQYLLDSCVASGNPSCEPSPTCHQPGSRSGSLLPGCLSPATSIVAGSSMLLPCICLFSLPKIFVQQQSLISKSLCAPAVCSQPGLQTSAPRVGVTARAPALSCAPQNQLQQGPGALRARHGQLRFRKVQRKGRRQQGAGAVVWDTRDRERWFVVGHPAAPPTSCMTSEDTAVTLPIPR